MRSSVLGCLWVYQGGMCERSTPAASAMLFFHDPGSCVTHRVDVQKDVERSLLDENQNANKRHISMSIPEPPPGYEFNPAFEEAVRRSPGPIHVRNCCPWATQCSPVEPLTFRSLVVCSHWHVA